MCKEIFEKHKEHGTANTLSKKARGVYQNFSDEIVTKMNKQLQEDIMVQDNMSKDPWIFIKYSIYFEIDFKNYLVKAICETGAHVKPEPLSNFMGGGGGGGEIEIFKFDIT